MYRPLQRSILVGSVVTIALNVSESLDTTHGQLERDGLSREALVAPSTATSSFTARPLLDVPIRFVAGREEKVDG